MTGQEPTTTKAILGADTVVGSALRALLEGCGYKITPLDARSAGVVGELLDGADLLLLAPRLEEAAREAFLGAMGEGARQRASVPVIALRTALEQAPLGEGVLSVPWPCETGALVERIEAALREAPPKLPHEGPDSIGAVPSGRAESPRTGIRRPKDRGR